jgi:type VI secretion system secreted protein VgrG
MRLQRLCFLILLLLTLPAYAESVTLGTAANFGVLGGSAVTNTGPTTINGYLGVSPGASITNTAGITINGVSYPGSTTVLNNSGVAAAQADALAAYNAAAALPYNSNLSGEDLGTVGTLTPGVYFFSSSAALTGALTLNSEGLTDAVFVFQIGTSLITATGSSVIIENPGSNDLVIWEVGSSATLGTTTAFEGNILADQSITLDSGASISCGSALAQAGTVKLDANTISTGCNGLPASSPPTNNPVPEPGSMTLLGSGLIALAGLVRRWRHS